MFNRLSEISMFAYGAVAAGFFAIGGGLYALDATSTAAAPIMTTEAAVDLAAYDAQVGASANVMAQINRGYQFPIIDAGENQAYLVPLFAAADTLETTKVQAAVLVTDLVAFDAMLAENIIGNARIGELYAIAGTQIAADAWAPSIAAAMEMAGLNATQPISIIQPTPAATSAAAMPLAPIGLALGALGLAVLAFGFVANRRDRQNSDVLSDRFQNLQGFVVPAE